MKELTMKEPISMEEGRRVSFALFVDRSSQQWIVLDAQGQFWMVPADEEDAWNQRQPFYPTDETILEPIVHREAPRRLFRRVMDPWIASAMAYLQARQACVTTKETDRLARKMPHVHAAYVLYTSRDKLARGLVEARLLAGQSIEQTAAACGLPAEVVHCYEALFFRVRGLLQHRLHIRNYAFPPPGWDDCTEADVDEHLKRAGFLKGSVMVDLFAASANTRCSPSTALSLPLRQLSSPPTSRMSMARLPRMNCNRTFRASNIAWTSR
jgi:hypothetical protein